MCSLKQMFLPALSFLLLAFTLGWVAAQDALAVEETPVTTIKSRTVSEGTHSIRIELQSLSRCMFGDLDTLLLDLQGGALALQLTLESIGSNRREVIYGLATAEKGTQNFLGSYELTLPQRTIPKLYGLFLCTIPKEKLGKQSCTSQRLLDPNEAAKEFRVSSESVIANDGSLRPAPLHAASGTTNRGKIHYFNFMIVGPAEVGFASNAMHADGYTAVTSYLSAIHAPVEDPQELVAELRNYGETLGSIPFAEGVQTLVVKLPFYDTARCMGTTY